MSTRAYRLISVETEKEHSFNLSGQWELASELEYCEQEGGIYTIDREKLIELLANSEMLKTYGVDSEQQKRLRQDVEASEGDDFIEYWCY